MLQISKSSTGLGNFMRRMVAEPPEGEGKERQRSLALLCPFGQMQLKR